MAVDYGGLDLTFEAGGAVTAYTIVALATDSQVDMLATPATEICLGVAQEAATAAGDKIVVRVSGVTKVLAGGAIVEGTFVGPHTVDGEAVAFVAGTMSVLGIALADAADTTYAKVLLKQGVPATA